MDGALCHTEEAEEAEEAAETHPWAEGSKLDQPPPCCVLVGITTVATSQLIYCGGGICGNTKRVSKVLYIIFESVANGQCE